MSTSESLLAELNKSYVTTNWSKSWDKLFSGHTYSNYGTARDVLPEFTINGERYTAPAKAGFLSIGALRGIAGSDFILRKTANGLVDLDSEHYGIFSSDVNELFTEEFLTGDAK